MIGKPICMDGVTASKKRTEFAKLLIEVTIVGTKRIEAAVLESKSGEEYVIPVEFDWIPWNCTRCECFGHTYEYCLSIKKRRAWGRKWKDSLGALPGGLTPKDSIPITEVNSLSDQGRKDGRVAEGDLIVRNGAGTSELGNQAQEGLEKSVEAQTREAQNDG